MSANNTPAKKYKFQACHALVFVYCAVFFGSGCGIFVANVTEFDRDVSGRSEYWGGYVQGDTYVNSVDVFLLSVDDWKKRLVIGPPHPRGIMEYTGPPSAEQYRADPTAWPDAVDVIPKGTSFKVQRLQEHGAATVGSSIYILVVIQDGTHKGKEVDITNMSEFIANSSNPVLFRPDPQLLSHLNN